MNKSILDNKGMLPLLVIVGILLVALAKQLKPGPQQNSEHETAAQSRYVISAIQPHTPIIYASGIVKASEEFTAMAEVAGTLIYKHPKAVNGAVFESGALIARIDDTDYKLALQKAQADLKASKARLQELKLQESNLKQQNKLSKQRLDYSQQELKRKSDLHQKGSLSASVLDAEQQKLISLKQEYSNIRQQLASMPSQRSQLEAQQQIATASVETQRRNVQRTEIRAPFSGRLHDSQLQQDQFIALGSQLFHLSGLTAVDIETQFTLNQMRAFLAFMSDSPNDITEFNSESLQQLIKRFELKAKVSLPGSTQQTWDADVISVRESIDPTTKTIGVIVRVKQPYKNIVPGVRPPLLVGLQVNIALKGKATPAIRLPVSVQKGEKVYQLNSDNQLQVISTSPALRGEQYNLYHPNQLAAGQRFLTDDLVPALPGMLIDPVPNTEAE